jgi:hypothetical protein
MSLGFKPKRAASIDPLHLHLLEPGKPISLLIKKINE